jgi:thiamine biosynthesis lipoprotein
MPTVTLARRAMNTRFELVLHGDSATALRAAAEEALTEVERIEAQLSLFRPSSEIARVNALAHLEPVRVSPEVFALLEHAQCLSAATHGAFDLTLAPLLHCWGLLGRNDGHIPTDAELATARACCSWPLVELDADRRTVHFARPGVMLDLGALGKGYAVQQAALGLREADVTSALIHGGTSTVFALGTPPDADGWQIAIESPRGADHPPLTTVTLRDESLSVSTVSAKSFQHADQTFGHVIDPRSGKPTNAAQLAAVILPDATETDAVSTALLVLGPAGLVGLTQAFPQMRALVAHGAPAATTIQTLGLAAPTAC